MAVYTAASDETGTADSTGNFFYCGFVAPTSDWEEHFIPAWDERVLSGPPPIPYLHMTDIRSRKWRLKHGISEVQADQRVDIACDVIHSMGSLFLISSGTNEGLWRDRFKTFSMIRENTAQPAIDRMVPDIAPFFGFVTTALQYGALQGADRVDFIIERKNGVTPILMQLFERMRATYPALGRPDYAQIMGKVIPGGKDRIPLQAADTACWHLQRRDQGTLSRFDHSRYSRIGSRFGYALNWKDEWTERMAKSAQKNKALSPFAPKIKQKRDRRD